MFRLSIDDKQEEYLPGQSFVGRVHYSVNDAEYVEINVSLKGKEFAYNLSSTTETQEMAQEPTVTVHKNKFLQEEHTVIHKGNLSAGTYEFPFKLTLPGRIPSSYVGKYGRVQFLVKAYLESHNKEQRKDKIEIKIFSPIHLSEEDTLSKTGNIYGTELTIENWFCSHEEIEMEVQLQKTTFIVGEVVNVVLMIKNNSHLYIPYVSIKLLMTTVPIVFTGQDRFLTTSTVIVSHRSPSVHSYRSSSFVFNLKIPGNAEIPNFERCSFFSNIALLEVAATLKNAASTMPSVKVNISLGHISPEGQSFIPKIQSLPNDIRAHSSITSAIITPLEYGMSKGIFASVTTSAAKTEGIPPYPTNFDPQIFLRDPSPRNSSLEQLPQVQMPMPLKSDTFKSADPPYQVEENIKQASMYPPKASSTLPGYPPYMKSDAGTCPYPTDGTSDIPRPSSSSLSYLPCPYPFPEERFKASKLSSRSSSSTEDFFPCETSAPYPPIINPPYPKAAFSGTELAVDMPALPSTKVNPPYPVLENDTRRSKPPYPTSSYPPEEPHTSLNIPMPMPSRLSPVACDSIGFAVPTTVSRVQNVQTDDEYEPSAPLLPSETTEEVVVAGQSDNIVLPTPPDHIPTPPIAVMDERSDPFPNQTEDAPPSYDTVVSSTKTKIRPKRQAALDS